MKRAKRKAKKPVKVSFPSEACFNDVAPHLYSPEKGIIYLTPGFHAGDNVLVTITKIGPRRRKGDRA